MNHGTGDCPRCGVMHGLYGCLNTWRISVADAASVSSLIWRAPITELGREDVRERTAELFYLARISSRPPWWRDAACLATRPSPRALARSVRVVNRASGPRRSARPLTWQTIRRMRPRDPR